ncbi:LOW QUALITY PROTEIN: potassium transporter 5 [Jatropha curcas]|uniref:LOW QUALITY PROTEIN: potassium transporter 5 n=1 Tax=Jatropha curcas TaxID=180498 RepID=UPI0018946DBD|nr:LOW QUALITY PROTEIN: potassium transporter 5 [Jatropha curcas]
MGEVEEVQELDDNHQQNGQGKGLIKKEKDSFDMEAGGSNSSYRNRQVADWTTVLKLAFQCIGIVYGDLGTSPLYVLPGIFQDGIKHSDDLLGVLSLIVYSIVTISLIKYVFIVLSANDNGDGGTFALYSLICRHARVSLIPTQQAEDKEVSTYKFDLPNRRSVKMASYAKSWLENRNVMKYVLLLTTIIGVSMLLGDGILTPCISVLSAVGGLKVAIPSLTDDAIMWISVVILSLTEDTIMWISVVILIFLFQIQRFGTHKVGYSFAPILVLWFLLIGIIGIYNFLKYDPSVIKALNPWCIIQYFQRNKKEAWISLGGVVLCLTGSEALFADLGHFDLGHFNIRSIQLSSSVVLVPSVLLAYFGQCSYLRKHNADFASAFYSSIPKALYWPQFVLAILAAIIASQSLISASFSIVQQSLALGCFPRVKTRFFHCDTEQGSKVKDPLALPVGPITRARATKLRAALNAFTQETKTHWSFKNQ